MTATAIHRPGCDHRTTHIEIASAYYEAMAADRAFISEFLTNGLTALALSQRDYRSSAENAFEDAVAVHQPRPRD
jgi:hypothetical protein